VIIRSPSGDIVQVHPAEPGKQVHDGVPPQLGGRAVQKYVVMADGLGVCRQYCVPWEQKFVPHRNVPGGAGQSASDWMSTPLTLASQSLRYRLPSHPQTGSSVVMQSCGRGKQVPAPEQAPLAPWQ